MENMENTIFGPPQHRTHEGSPEASVLSQGHLAAVGRVGPALRRESRLVDLDNTALHGGHDVGARSGKVEVLPLRHNAQLVVSACSR